MFETIANISLNTEIKNVCFLSAINFAVGLYGHDRQLHKKKTVNVGINVALMHVRLTTVAVQMQEVLHIMSVSASLVIQHA